MKNPKTSIVDANRLLFAAMGLTLAAALIVAAQENLGRGRIAGQVVDAAGAPVAGAKVVAQIQSGSTQLDTMTDKKGHFAIAGLGSGVWRVTASKEGYASAATDVNVAQLRTGPPVSLTLQKLEGGPEASKRSSRPLPHR